jgi:phosphatidylglycerophosphatase GEP4
MNTLNISATLNVFRLLAKPTLCLPHAMVPTFNQLPIPLNNAFGKYKNVDIRAVVLDKDNCFAYPNSNKIHKPYKVSSNHLQNLSSWHLKVLVVLKKSSARVWQAAFFTTSRRPILFSASHLTKEVYSDSLQEHFQRLKEAYPGHRLLVVSNSAGTSSLDPSLTHSLAVEASTGVRVLTHSTKKPGCGPEIMEYFRKYPETGVTRPDQIAVVGDRLTTDIMLANLMGGYAVWVRDGVIGEEGDGLVSGFVIILGRKGRGMGMMC